MIYICRLILIDNIDTISTLNMNIKQQGPGPVRIVNDVKNNLYKKPL